jgi:ankyrin repeat protein
MRENPDIDQLKRQARELLEAYRAQSPDAVTEVAAHHRTATPETFALHDAQFVLARSYGFESWPKLKAAVDGVTTARLHAAVQKGDSGAVRALLARRPEIVDLMRGGPSGFEIRPLHIAVMQRDVEMTCLLLEAGADTRGGIWPNRDATSPRTIAEDRGYDEIVAMMVAQEEKRGARGSKGAGDGLHRLRDAMRTGGEEAVIAVFESQPSLAGVCPPDGVTMLHCAAGQGMLLVAKWLLDHGADVNRKSHPDFWWREERTPLDFAAWECAEEPSRASTCEAMAALLIERGAALTPLSAAALGRWDYLALWPLDPLQGKGLLQAAVRNNRPAVLSKLLEMGLDPNERMQLGHHEDQTFSSGGPLMEAVNTGRIELARLLLEHGADPNANVFTSGSPTFAAYAGGSPRVHAPDPAMIDLMVEHGGWIDAEFAGYLRRPDLARRMLDGELDPHLDGPFSSEKVAEQLLWSGASGRSADIVRMALERIDWPRDDPRWFWMLWRPLPGHEDLTAAEQADCCESFRLILERCDPNLRAGESGQTMLHEVIARDHGVGVSLASMLLDAGARTDVRDEFLKSTALGWACRWGRVELVKLLLARGADPIEAEAEPWAAPLAWAERRQHAAIVPIVRQHGAHR